ncbi:hypothetical protein [Streptomyces noursei]|uniref:hypothetical protein n=1 Tax=Streptomyces noursei TaxID=1971 RepID=UPI0023B82F6E|nr:hypothetical protein [Streptomyces noursei]
MVFVVDVYEVCLGDTVAFVELLLAREVGGVAVAVAAAGLPLADGCVRGRQVAAADVDAQLSVIAQGAGAASCRSSVFCPHLSRR